MTLRPLAALLIAATLAACGADGAPQRPAAKDGVTIEGEAWIGVTGKL